MCLLVVDNQIMLADSASLPVLMELDQNYRALSLRRWSEALLSIGVSGGTK
jgi:hypothetical protein